MTIEVNDTELQKLINDEAKPILIDFWAPWCGPCKAMAPALDTVAAKLADKLVVAKLNVDESTVMAAKFQIRSIPTLVLMKDGNVLSARTGAMPASALENWLAQQVA